MNNSYMGTILRINLKTGTILREPLNQKNADEYVGARGLGTKYYCDECDPNCDAMGPDNKLIFMTGPLTGTASTSAGRYNAVAKSPLTGTIGAANSGGHFGPELKYAGYDGIIFEDVADHPVYLYINDDVVELRDASHLWGKDVFETTDALYEECGSNFRIACISAAGETGCLFAGIMNDKHRAAGRGGMGAVMGVKKLKAVAVKGTKSIFVARPKQFIEACMSARDKLKAHPVTGAGLSAYGTMILVNIVNGVGGMPVGNGRDGASYADADDISGETLAAKHLIRNKGCFGCSIGCGRLTEIKSGPYKSQG
ncbi:MAG: aldehyde ferredoxin oxidoreductase N-terminal domain-containing protein, partial [Lawsonibacter sp.]